jgi:hypothetical protein
MESFLEPLQDIHVFWNEHPSRVLYTEENQAVPPFAAAWTPEQTINTVPDYLGMLACQPT